VNWLGPSRPFGLDIGSTVVKAVELKQSGSAVTVSRAALLAMPAGTFSSGVVLDPTAASAIIRQLCRDNQFRSKRVITVPTGGDEFFARLKVERKGGQALDVRVREEVAKLAPFPLETAQVDFELLDNSLDLDWFSVLAAAARKEKIDRLQELLSRAGKTAAVVDVTACAMVNAFERNYLPKPEAVTALIDIGASGMTVCVVRGSTPLVAEYFPLAARSLALRMEDADPASRIVLELEKLFKRMDEKADGHPLDPRSKQVERLLLSGGGSRTSGLAVLLRDRLGIPFEEMNPFRKIEFDSSKAMSRVVWDHSYCMVIALGLALRGLDYT